MFRIFSFENNRNNVLSGIMLLYELLSPVYLKNGLEEGISCFGDSRNLTSHKVVYAKIDDPGEFTT